MSKHKPIAYRTQLRAQQPYWRSILLVFVLFVVTTAVLFPALQSDFTNWDDDVYVVDNPHITSLSIDNIYGIFKNLFKGVYVPLTILSFAIEYHFFKLQPFYYHLTNLILHLGVITGVYFVGMQLGLTMRGAFMAALLFGIHPMHVESVAWVTERKDVLYAIFYIYAVWSYQKYLFQNSKRYYLLSLVLSLLSVLAKPMALSLPLVLWICDWYHKRSHNIRGYIDKIPYGIILIPIVWITYSVHARVPGKEWPDAALIWCKTFSFYLEKFFLPFKLSPLYQLPEPVYFVTGAYMMGVLVVLAFVCLIIGLRKQRLFLFACGTFFASIFFLLRFNIGTDLNIVADRFMYLPSFGICLWLGYVMDGGLQVLKKRRMGWITPVYPPTQKTTGLPVDEYERGNSFASADVRPFLEKADRYSAKSGFAKMLSRFASPRSRRSQTHEVFDKGGLPNKKFGAKQNHLEGATALAVGLHLIIFTYFVVLGVQAHRLSRIWQNSTALWTYVIKQDPQLAVAYNNRGKSYSEQGKLSLALRDYDKALLLDPLHVSTMNNRADVFYQQGDVEAALRDLTNSLRIKEAPIAYYNRGNIYIAIGQYNAAENDYSMAIKLGLQKSEVFNNRGVVFLHLKRFEDAYQDFSQAIEINPLFYDAYNNRGYVLSRTGKQEEAITEFNKALGIRPDYGTAYYNRGNAYRLTGNYSEAVKNYDQALVFHAPQGYVYFYRSLVYHELGQYIKALHDAREAKRLGVNVEDSYTSMLEALIFQK